MDQIKELKSIKTRSIVSLVLFITILGLIVSLVLNLIDCIKILSTKWENKEVEDSKLLWGILSLVLLGPIGSLVFACISLNKMNAK